MISFHTSKECFFIGLIVPIPTETPKMIPVVNLAIFPNGNATMFSAIISIIRMITEPNNILIINALFMFCETTARVTPNSNPKYIPVHLAHTILFPPNTKKLKLLSGI
jgi:hypothetical protein